MTEATARFSDRVADYVRYRPGYPPEIVDFLHRSGVARDALVADVGAGTGISTKLLLDAGHRVVAVEPNAAMREACDVWLGGRQGYESVAGSAEATGLPAASVGLVFAAQAFHWFGPGAKSEFLRILRRDAGYDRVALVWNDRRTDGSEFLRGYERLLRTYGTDYAAVAETYGDDAKMDAWFGGKIARRSFPHAQELDFEGLRGRLLSASYAPKAGDPRHEPMLAALRQLFDATSGPAGRVVLEYDAHVYCGRPAGD